MNPERIADGAMVALTSGAVGIIAHIANEDDPQALQAGGPIDIRLMDEGAIIHVTCAEIAEIDAPNSAEKPRTAEE